MAKLIIATVAKTIAIVHAENVSGNLPYIWRGCDFGLITVPPRLPRRRLPDARHESDREPAAHALCSLSLRVLCRGRSRSSADASYSASEWLLLCAGAGRPAFSAKSRPRSM